MRITAIDQGGIIRLTALDRAAQIVHQRFAHQVLWEVAPGLRTVVSADPGQNTQPRLFTFRLQIAEIATRMHRFGFHIDMAPIQLEAFIVTQPVEHRIALFNFKRRTEDRFVRHSGVMHIDR